MGYDFVDAGAVWLILSLVRTMNYYYYYYYFFVSFHPQLAQYEDFALITTQLHRETLLISR